MVYVSIIIITTAIIIIIIIIIISVTLIYHSTHVRFLTALDIIYPIINMSLGALFRTYY